MSRPVGVRKAPFVAPLLAAGKVVGGALARGAAKGIASKLGQVAVEGAKKEKLSLKVWLKQEWRCNNDEQKCNNKRIKHKCHQHKKWLTKPKPVQVYQKR